MRFQKIVIFKLLKAGDCMKTITRTKYLDRIIELNGAPDIKRINLHNDEMVEIKQAA